MSPVSLSMVISVILSVSKEAVAKKIDRDEAINRMFERLNIPREPANDFESIYTHTLIEYGEGKPEPVLNFFRNEFIQEAFRKSFNKDDPSILESEAEDIIQWNEETGELGKIDYDPRREIDDFTLTFNKIVERIRTPKEVKQDHKIDEINRKLEIQGEYLKENVFPLLSNIAQGVSDKSLVLAPDWSRGDLIYQLDLLEPLDLIKAELLRWDFLTTSSTPPTAAVANGVIGIGQSDGATFNLSPIDPIDNCSVECEVRIIDDGNDQDNWAGIRVRAFDFCYDLRLGYLIYLRRSGSVELYGPEGVMDGFGQVRVPETKDSWTHLRMDLLNHEIRAFVNGDLHLQSIDKTFGGRVRIYLHTFGTHSQFKNFEVYKLEI